MLDIVVIGSQAILGSSPDEIKEVALARLEWWASH